MLNLCFSCGVLQIFELLEIVLESIFVFFFPLQKGAVQKGEGREGRGREKTKGRGRKGMESRGKGRDQAHLG